MQARRAGVLALLVSLVALGCQPDPIIENTDVGMDLGPCLGAIEAVAGDRDGGNAAVLSTCRTSVNDSVDPASTVNVCFIAREVADNALTQRIPYTWRNGSLSAPFPERVLDLGPARRMDAALFFLSAGDEDGTVCEQFEVDSACDGNDACVMRLLQAEPVLIGEEGTTFDFTDGEGRCNSQVGPAFGDMGGGLELCDGMDNDCDRVIDEGAIDEGNTCGEDLGVGACAISGTLECRGAQGLVCSVTQAEADARAAPDENCDEADCCDGVDADCDGVVDENIPCSPCETNEDCAENIAGPICVEGLCKVCDPADHDGCSENDLCCGTGPGAFECQGTSFGPEAGEQCAACGDPCIALGADGRPLVDVNGERISVADGCSGRTCSCGFGPACGDTTPFCISGQCLECRDNGDCGPQELCCDGTCEPTGPDTQCGGCGEPCNLTVANRCIDRECRCGESEACSNGAGSATCIASPDCDPEAGGPECSPQRNRCEECEFDNDCDPTSTERACVERQCRECKDDEDIFCVNAGLLADENRGQCVGSDCFECDRRNHDGCAEDGDAPFCDTDENECRACESDAECQVRPGDRDQCVAGRCVVCDPETYDGCSDPNAPVCDGGTFECRGCRATAECEVISEDDEFPKECVDGQCRGCNPDGNRGCAPIGPAPICNAETLVCRGCFGDDECPSVEAGARDDDRDGPGPYRPASESTFCVAQECRECDPDGHRGCAEASDRPICLGGNCEPCARDADCDGRPGDLDQCIPDGAAQGQCKICDPADNAGCDDPANPVCDAGTFTCVPCGDDGQCNRGRDPGLAPIECVDGTCAECDPRPGQLNVGCDPLGDVPFCDEERAFCRRCASSAECVALDSERGLDVQLFGCVEGDCTECDPVTQIGCPDTQVCGANGRCRACAVDGEDPLNLEGDQECALGDGDRDQCVAGRCEVCDPVDFAGCDPASGQPVCDADTVSCRGCGPDSECEAGPDRPASPIGEQCVEGFCRACDPSRGEGNAGCEAAGVEPYCDPVLFDCAPCGTGVEGEDTRCESNPRAELSQCIGERCAECDPNNHEGCAEDAALPFCDPGRAVCRVCNNDAECNIRPGNRDQCVAERCEICDPADDAGCNNPNQPICDNGTRTCRRCNDDAECPGALLCVTGRCVQCDPADNDGCDVASATPYCDPGNNTCRACTVLPGEELGEAPDSECVDAALPQCVGGSCEQCDPNTHDGCDEDSATPFCGADGQCRGCGNDAECVLRPGSLDYCSAGECVQCNRDTEAGCPGNAPVCDDGTQTCRRCRNSDECTGNQECVDGTCVGCDPDTNVGCDADGTASVCDRQTQVCRPCGNDGECNGNPNGDQCFSDRCVECDPSGNDQVGCNVAGVEPFCASDGSCRECRTDAECVIAPGDRDQCVGVRCELCDPADDAGCDAASDRPVCGGGAGNRACRGCNDDAECADNPNGNQCVSGSCVQCDPGNDDGCDANGDEPKCDAGTRTCVGCQNDNDCNGNQNGGQCVDGSCEECDPEDSAGCAENQNSPICDAGTKTCQACGNDAECILRPGNRNVCVTPNCRVCDPADDSGCSGNTPICANGNRCRGCNNNGECGDNECLPDGSCAGCNPDNNAGCDAVNPICDRQTEQCRPCRADDECGAGFCFEGRCEVCDPEGHAGCGGNELCCQAGDIFACQATDPDTQCAACGVTCDADGDAATAGSNVCTNRTCRCGPLVECDAPQPYCLGDDPDGVCSECRDNDDCATNSTTPICGADIQGNDSNTCRGCQNDDECADHPRGAQCIAAGGQTGACHVCDPANNDGCDANGNQPVCGANNLTCRGCNNDGECAGNPNGGQCVNGACEACDPSDDAGCVGNSETPVCIGGNVCGCADDGDCAGNPNGTQCVGGICAECDPAAVNNGAANGGCDLAGNTPYCDPANNTCVGCAGDDNRCANNGNGNLCDTNRCVECLVGPTHDGCNDTELCCDTRGRPECVGTDLAECIDCGTACDAETSDACTDRACTCGGGPECEVDEFCDGGNCVECRDDGDCNDAGAGVCHNGTCVECEPGNPANGCDADGADTCTPAGVCECDGIAACGAGEFCVPDPAGDGQCGDCSPEGNAGCDPASNTPICDPATLQCTGCDDSGECAADDGLGDYCVFGACEACDPDTHGGCAGDELCCDEGDGQGLRCIPNAANANANGEDRCESCLPGLGECNGMEACVGRVCQ